MKGKNNQEETYFLGKAQETRYTKSHIYKKVFGIAACVIAIIGITIDQFVRFKIYRPLF